VQRTPDLPNAESLLSRTTSYGAMQVAALFIGALLLAPIGCLVAGSLGAIAAVLAAAICAMGAVGGHAVALLVADSVEGPQRAMVRPVVGMLLRMGVPLAFAIVVYLQGGPLAEAGLVYYLLAFYMIALAVEIWQSTVAVNERGV